MKKIILSIFVIGSIFCSCNGNKEKEQNIDTVVAIEAATVVNDEEAAPSNEENQKLVEDFLKDLYTNYLYGTSDFDKIANHFSPSVLKRLADAYDMECPPGNCYEISLLRGMSQDYDEAKVLDITPSSDNWYNVTFSEDNTKYTIEIQASVIDGNVMVTDFKDVKKI